MGFVSDNLGNGQALRALTLVDNFSRVSPAIEVDFSLTGKRVVEVLERVSASYGQPRVIKCDNGPEFASRAVDEWAYRKGVKLGFSRPGRPTDNAYIESFNGGQARVPGSALVRDVGGGASNGRAMEEGVQ